MFLRPEPTDCIRVFQAPKRIWPVLGLRESSSDMQGRGKVVRKTKAAIWIECRDEYVQATLPVSLRSDRIGIGVCEDAGVEGHV